jgi:rhodanese-related sulfurtransferase
VLDVRKPPRFAASDRILATARHCGPDDLDELIGALPPREAVVYCVYGHEVSQVAAAQLRQAGWSARYLEGGIEGGEVGVDAPEDLSRWREQALPTIRKRRDMGVTGERPSRWITRSRPKIDRVACPWLIRRFIDPRAEFFYVRPERVLEEASRLGATPFDIEGAQLSHERERCTFDSLLAAFDLLFPALDRLATIVRGADTTRSNIAPEAAGLLALSLGMSRLYQDDQEMFAAAMPVYDALYAWCAAPTETPSWQANACGEAA